MIAPSDLREIIRHCMPTYSPAKFNPVSGTALAGAQRGFHADRVRAPLTDPTEEKVRMVPNLIDGRG